MSFFFEKKAPAYETGARDGGINENSTAQENSDRHLNICAPAKGQKATNNSCTCAGVLPRGRDH
eukprot:scaffold11046_cov183-Amphora_coffeaeformis.AAC.11